jgi:phage antirepressor YoqD-like protein
MISAESTNHHAPRIELSENVARHVKMSSREIAELVGKRHDNVKRTIETLTESGVIVRPQIEDEPGVDSLGRPRATQVYLFSGEKGKRDSIVVVAQLSPEFTARLVDRWQELEAERQAVALPNFNRPAEAARAWADQFEQRAAAEQALAVAAPKAEFVDRYVDSTGLKGFRQVAKLLNANEARFREFLIDRKIMYRLGGEWMAYQNHIDAGRFDVKTGASDSGHAFNQTKFTPKGVNWIAGLWAQAQLKDAVA